ncbi:MAG: sugar phosphate isomerase/epimerase family protein [Clostridia bacterium]|nr:sugar phosphate isomerase/epimerase family protein [Clostridia bacterium]
MNREFKLGMFSWFGYILPLPERLRLIQQAGFASISLWWEDEYTPALIKKEHFAALVREAGLFFENIHAPFINTNDLWSADKAAREKAVQQYLTWLEDCAQYAIPLLVMHLTEGDEPPEANKYGLESMMALVRGAEERSVKIAVENTRRTNHVSFVLNEIPSDYLGLCYDSSHARLCPDRGETLLNRFGQRLLATHLSDNDGKEDRHWVPGNGIINWNSLMNKFIMNNYTGYLTLEVAADPEERKGPPEVFVQKAFQRLTGIRQANPADRSK